MKYLVLLLVSTLAFAQSSSVGLKLPGLPTSLGQKTMANSTSVTVASDQTPVAITGSITATNPSVSPNGSAVPAQSTYVGMNANGTLVGISGSSRGVFIDGSNYTQIVSGSITVTSNSSGSQVTNATIGTGGSTLSPPANAVGFLLQASDVNTANVRWAVGSAATTTSGQQLQPGRDTGYMPVAASVNVTAEAGTQEVQIQWVNK